MKILGISCYYHDSAAALVIDGRPVSANQEERFSRIKNDPAFPKKSIEICLKKNDLFLSELDAVVFYEKPLLKFDRVLDTLLRESPYQPSHFVESISSALPKTIFLRKNLTAQLKEIDPLFSADRLLFSEHHLSHAASAFFPSPFENAVVLTMDGLGEWATTTVSIGDESSLKVIKEIQYPHSLGLFYSALTTFCGFKVNSGEYKLMGLAPYGIPRFRDLILRELIQLQNDGSFKLGLKYFNFSSSTCMFTTKMRALFGVPPRRPETTIDSVYMDIAASTQSVLTEAILNLTQNLAREFPYKNLCLAGGVALNCVSSTQILKQGFYDNVWIQPAAGDAGAALGAALAAHSLHFKQQRHRSRAGDNMSFAYLGRSYSSDEIRLSLEKNGLIFEHLDEASLLQKTCDYLLKENSIGWFQGKMEFGPRALGARSILANAKNPEMQKMLNLKIKFRESFRPFAPIVIEEKAKDWFVDLPETSPYMTFVGQVKTDHLLERTTESQNSFERLASPRSTIPSVTHLDLSARVQTVSKNQNPRLYQLLLLFEEQSGTPILINTSFNVRGEPIVESPDHAIDCFLKNGLDALVIGDFFIDKKLNLSKLRAQNLDTLD